MEEQQQRRLEIIRTCLNRLDKYFVGSQCSTSIAEAQLQLDKLLSAYAPAGAYAEVVLPISPDEAAKARAGQLKHIPPKLMSWINDELVKNYDLKAGSSHIDTRGVPEYDWSDWLNTSALRLVYNTTGWDVSEAERGVFGFSKRDEKQAPPIN
jgi:hypothetical protein